MKPSGLVRTPGNVKDFVIKWLILWLAWLVFLTISIAFIPGTVEWIKGGPLD